MPTSHHKAWLAGLLRNLENSGDEAAAAAEYIRQHRVRISVHDQPTGARWTIGRRIEINPRYARLSPDEPYALSLVIHEVLHLEQGILTALSVYGELQAWKLQFGYLKRALGAYQSDAAREPIIAELMQLSPERDRAVLQRARKLMRTYAGPKYRVDLLPLYPLPAEVQYQFTHWQGARFE